MFSIESVERVQKAVTVPINRNDGHIDVEVKKKSSYFQFLIKVISIPTKL